MAQCSTISQISTHKKHAKSSMVQSKIKLLDLKPEHFKWDIPKFNAFIKTHLDILGSCGIDKEDLDLDLLRAYTQCLVHEDFCLKIRDLMRKYERKGSLCPYELMEAAEDTFKQLDGNGEWV